MEKATISQIKNSLSAYLKKVRSGRTILILDRDQPIARLERVSPDEHPDERLASLERAGIVRRAQVSVSVKGLRASVPTSKRSVVAALLEQRREDR